LDAGKNACSAVDVLREVRPLAAALKEPEKIFSGFFVSSVAHCKILHIFTPTNKQHRVMTTEMNYTGINIKYENGNVFGIHTKMTKKGLRYYKYFRGRYYPVSQMEINNRIFVA
jgi:hypothetical protein